MTSEEKIRVLEEFIRRISREEINKAVAKRSRFSSSKRKTRKVRNQFAQE